jgi:hypothetical protein
MHRLLPFPIIGVGGGGRNMVCNTKSKTFKETHNLKSGRIWCIGTQNVENGYKRAFFARLGEGLKKY